ncbi:unnamed protein product [Rhizoctonia solani]|uniref:Chitin-binding type-2 domain-containing protein n=1 Tax=Rhizoctonia solani TaxID=456999 RepID=A0A8H3GG48_9AGAM|nr:unnamed protein product [Rhizoctonia solani]
MLGFKIFAFIVACIAVVAAVPAPTHKHKDCRRKHFWWGRKDRCLPYGVIPVIVAPPPRHHCGRWYWDSGFGYCVPPQPDWYDPQCPAGWTWDDRAISCIPAVPAPIIPSPVVGYGPGQCGPSYFWWGTKACCLLSGGPSILPLPPNGWLCPDNWYWHGDGYCAPRTIGYGQIAPVCTVGYTWDETLFYCKRKGTSPSSKAK